jgi:23S rRNA (cytidine1920-2'-O)/16S rRNA (cytidine1409-2'-O)-methyltransferase
MVFHTFQHPRGKVCGKTGPQSCNLLLINHIQHSALPRVLTVLRRGTIPTSVKTRLDKLIVERGLTTSRERAQALILAGKVLVNEQKVEKAGASIDSGSTLRLLGEDLRYVSRGGLKLEKALEHWRVDLQGRVCLDIGASTGGFSDCMLQHGAAKVIAVDTGYGQIDFGLRNDPRMRLLEKTNARYLEPGDIGEPIDFIAMDVSFISATMVLPAVIRSTPTARQIVVLVKPQFEVGRELVGKGGIVRDQAAQRAAVARVEATLTELGGLHAEWIESPILGGEGNREFLLHAEFRSPAIR